MNQTRFKEMLREKGLKVTSQRLIVLETIGAHPGEHLTTEEIYELVKKKCPEIGLATIYRTVQVLVDLHVIDKISFDDGYARYELEAEGENNRHRHHHAICLQCKAVTSFEDDLLDNLEQALYHATGFTVTDHEVKLYGYCSQCRKKKEEKKNESNESKSKSKAKSESKPESKSESK